MHWGVYQFPRATATNYHKLGRGELKTTEMDSPQILEARRLKSRCEHSGFLLESWREELFHTSIVSGGCWQSWGFLWLGDSSPQPLPLCSRDPLPLCHSVSSPLLKDTSQEHLGGSVG